MPELLQIKTPHWELIVWSKRIDHKRKQLTRTLNSRGKGIETSSVRFSPTLALGEAIVEGESQAIPDVVSGRLDLSQPLFFENTEYQFEFVFDMAVCLVAFDARKHSHYFINLFLNTYNQNAPKKIKKEELIKTMKIASEFYALLRIEKYKNPYKAKELL